LLALNTGQTRKAVVARIAIKATHAVSARQSAQSLRPYRTNLAFERIVCKEHRRRREIKRDRPDEWAATRKSRAESQRGRRCGADVIVRVTRSYAKSGFQLCERNSASAKLSNGCARLNIRDRDGLSQPADNRELYLQGH
jgi:hypothetical protein